MNISSIKSRVSERSTFGPYTFALKLDDVEGDASHFRARKPVAVSGKNGREIHGQVRKKKGIVYLVMSGNAEKVSSWNPSTLQQQVQGGDRITSYARTLLGHAA